MLNRTRGGVVSAVTRVENFIKGLTEAEIPLLCTKGVLKSQLDIVKSMKLKFMDVQEQIIEQQISDDKVEAEKSYGDAIVERCDSLINMISSMIQACPEEEKSEKKEPEVQSDCCDFLREMMMANQTQMNQLLSVLTKNASRNEINSRPLPTPPAGTKLPEIKLPTFDGRFSQWISFRDKFRSQIINHPNLSDVQRLDYLLSALSSEAASAVENISITDSNFRVAWEILVDKFERKNEIVADHVRTFFTIPRVSESNPQAIHTISNLLNETVMALDAMSVTERDPWLIQFVIDRLDSESKVLWGRECGKSVPSLTHFRQFLHQRCIDAKNATESSSSSKGVPNYRNQNQKHTPKRQVAALTNPSEASNCRCCSESSHPLFRCTKFLAMSPFERYEVVKTLNLCRNCLMPHVTNSCTFRSCRKCHGRHNVLLHEKFVCESLPSKSTTSSVNKSESNKGETTNNSQNSSAVVALSSKVPDRSLQPNHRVYLATAMVDVFSANGERIPCRLLLDGGAQVCVITSELAQKLRLPKHPSNMAVVGVGGHQSRIQHRVTTTIVSQVTKDSFTFECQVMPRITGNVPNWTTNKEILNIPQNLPLADPCWADQKPVDILVCGDIYWSSFLPNVVSLGPGLPHLRETVFGYVIVGEHHSFPSQSGLVCHNASSSSSLEESLVKFWEVENVPDEVPVTDEHRAAEEHFVKTHSRTPEGRFLVKLPFKKNPDLLGESRPQAVRQFLALERQFEKKPGLKEAYSEIMNDQLERGWLEPVPMEDSRALSFYMPHHGVFKDSTTTKLRIVYNASAKSSSGHSLNDLLMLGPTVQDDLATILLRFRRNPVAFTADITKMYLQLVMDREDSDFQRLVWRENKSQPIKDYRISRVSFGVASSPFLATRALVQLAHENEKEYPLAAQALLKAFYVDDCLLSCESLAEAKDTQAQLIEVLQRGGFTLAKWTSKYPELTYPSSDSPSTQNIPSEHSITTALGMAWNSSSDKFLFSSPMGSPDEMKTKRHMASAIANLFDPIGLVGPVIIETKLMLQKLHELKYSWDKPVPEDVRSEWRDFTEKLLGLNQLEIPRWVSMFPHPIRTEIHAFSDASLLAYGVAVYVVTVDAENNRYSSLLLSKSRVAPLKNKLTVPKLELCGALLAAETIHKFKDSYNPDDIHYWSDSTIVLSWLRSPPDDYKIFVSKRVKRILELSKPDQWQHIGTKSNPADIISRGANPSKLLDCDLWWRGPEWLSEPKKDWPEPVYGLRTTLEAKCLVMVPKQPPFEDLFTKYSSLTKIQRIVAYSLRLAHHPSSTIARNRGPIAAPEMERALRTLIKVDQETSWPNLALLLERGIPLPSKWKSLLSLAPFLDSEGLIRVGGRLERSNESYPSRHPILLPKSRLTTMIARNEHLKQLHAPPTLLLASLRQQFWPVSGRSLTRRIVHECVPCYRVKPKPLDQIMADLPFHRVNLYRPFQAVGVDFAGPIQIICSATRGVRSRKSGTQKAYIAIYVCMATKAAHLEVVTSLSTEAFLASFRRFAARRTTPRHVFSDCGKNFQGAANELSRLMKQEEVQCKLSSATRDHGTLWHFNPPSSPHHGGLWEACVKAVKYHLVRVTNSKPLAYEELQTVLCQIESVLNSRPICLMSENPNDESFLTPGHFLHFAPGNAPPDLDLSHISDNRQSYWQACQFKVQEFGKKWRLYYLNTLQQRSRWIHNRKNLTVGEIVLLLDETNPEGCKWVLGKIEKVHPGQDGHVRVLTIKTTRGIYTRPITKVARLPISDAKNAELDHSKEGPVHHGEDVGATVTVALNSNFERPAIAQLRDGQCCEFERLFARL